jgi:hypothetical protein
MHSSPCDLQIDSRSRAPALLVGQHLRFVDGQALESHVNAFVQGTNSWLSQVDLDDDMAGESRFKVLCKRPNNQVVILLLSKAAS